jgi:hypothetical protein
VLDSRSPSSGDLLALIAVRQAAGIAELERRARATAAPSRRLPPRTRAPNPSGRGPRDRLARTGTPVRRVGPGSGAGRGAWPVPRDARGPRSRARGLAPVGSPPTRPRPARPQSKRGGTRWPAPEAARARWRYPPGRSGHGPDPAAFAICLVAGRPGPAARAARSTAGLATPIRALLAPAARPHAGATGSACGRSAERVPTRRSARRRQPARTAARARTRAPSPHPRTDRQADGQRGRARPAPG